MLLGLRSKRFKLVLANASVRLYVNGVQRPIPPPATPGPIGFLITPKGRAPLPANQFPHCR